MSHCQSCGACCASFRVDFAAEESEDEGGCVPAGIGLPLSGRTYRLRGTDHSPPRCAALTGQVGQKVACGIYPWRPNPCHEFTEGSEACERARRRHGLAALG